MAEVKKELVKMLNQALELEHSARIQYLTHAELIKGIDAEPVIERLKEIASDEEKHEGKFRNLLGNYLGVEPTMGIAETHKATGTSQILQVNLGNEKEAIDFYKKIYKLVMDNKQDFQYELETIEHELRHVIMDEQEHAAELSTLLGK
ncbi:MAG: ferritin-like domain-containing protein [Candidatus Omnitrophica bacterium]|nr:ferritin-like domain-containing protein [Candidatus Omnitrophota bacterium]